MNNVFFLPVLLFCLSIAGQAGAQGRPKVHLKRAFNHTSEAGKGKNDRAHFRKENTRPVIDLNPHTPEKFKTAKVGHHYKFAKRH